MKTGRLLLKNFFSLATAEVIARVAGFLTTAYLARVLGAEAFGKFGFAQSFVSYFIIFGVLGLNTYGIREIARKSGTLKALIGEILALQIVTTIVSFVLLVAIAVVLPRETEVRSLILLLSFSVFTHCLSMEWVFRGLEQMEWVAFVALLRNALYLVLIFALVHGAHDLFRVGATIVLAEFIAAAVFYVLYRRRHGGVVLNFDPRRWGGILRSSLPLASISFLIQVYYQLDIVMLGFWTTDAITGWYVSASTILLSLIGLGALLGSTLYPTLSRLLRESPERAQSLLQYAVRVVVAISVPMAVGGIILAPNIIAFVYGAGYDGAVTAFRVLMISVVLSFCSIPYTTALIARDERKYFLAATATGAFVNVFLNLWWIPYFQHVGAAAATVAAELCVFAISYVYGRRVARVSFFSIFPKPILAAAMMGWLASVVHWHVLLTIVVCMVFYFVCILLLGAFKISDMKLIRSALSSQKGA
jgi:O-antigen/teichoic acid export membrane protein